VDGIIVHRYKNMGKHNVDARNRVSQVVTEIESIQPNVVHIHGTNQYSYDVYQSLVKVGIKVLVTVHGLANVEKRNAFKKKKTLKTLYQYLVQSRTEYSLLSQVPQIIVDTEYVAEQIRSCYAKRYIKRLPEMHVIPQGINQQYAMLQSLCDEPIIFSLGAISKRKGHVLLVKAFELLCKQIPNAKLIIAGIIAEKDYYDELQHCIQQSQYTNQIQLCINLSQEQIFELYKRAKIFALHTQEESQGIVFAEAMAVGLPIVATNVGGVPYVVKHGENGLLSNYSDAAAFAENLATLLQDNTIYNSMVEAGKYESQRYLWTKIAAEIVELYANLLD
jgi:glycosyltransferase involved in cell wall biosynthesis